MLRPSRIRNALRAWRKALDEIHLSINPPTGIIGQRFGRLVVEGMSERKSGKGREALYLCRCDCGKFSHATKTGLTATTQKQHRVSCGCQKAEKLRALGKSNFRSLVGQQFSRLKVVAIADIPSLPKRGAMYTCWCACGHVKNARAADLRSGDIQSCGCLARELASSRMKKLTDKQRKERQKRSPLNNPKGHSPI